MYILKNAFRELGFRLTRLGSGNQPLTLKKSVTDLGKSVTDFGETRHRLWRNLPPILGNPFQFWGNTSPILGKNMCLFGKNRLRFWEKHAPFFFFGRTGSVFGKNI